MRDTAARTRKGPFVKTRTRALETKVSRRGPPPHPPRERKAYVGHRGRCITAAPHAAHPGILVTGERAPTAAAKLSLCHKVSRKKGGSHGEMPRCSRDGSTDATAGASGESVRGTREGARGATESARGHSNLW